MRYFGVFVDDTNDFYTYSDPNNEYNIGDRVMVAFRGRLKSALIVYEEDKTEFEFKVLAISKKLENHVGLSREMVKLLLWIKSYYLCSFGQVLGAAIPGNLKVEYIEEYELVARGIPSGVEEEKIIEYFTSKEWVGRATLLKRFGKGQIERAIESKVLEKDSSGKKLRIIKKDSQYEDIISYYEERLRVGKQTLDSKYNSKAIKSLIEREVISLKKRLREEAKKIGGYSEERTYEKKSATLSKMQEMVVNDIIVSENRYHLIKGVTGSGKTEVYIKLIRDVLSKGQGSIFLVPEISITPQMISRFKGEFEGDIAILHSRLSPSERASEWLDIQRGEKRIVVGVRSAIFAPVKNLKYIVIDEEHESTYKQDSNPRYSAKYVGIKRGELEDAKVILGSATPSIESYYLAKQGVFDYHEMNSRYNDAKLPELKLVDMKKEENVFFSRGLLEDISKTLKKEEQIMLLLNRKGYSTYIQCLDCGHVEECPHCSISMNYYKQSGIYKCNYCGHTKRYSGRCSSCKSENIDMSGRGTERLEEELGSYFGDTGIVRVDSDTSKESGFYEKMYREFLEKKQSIMLGTQIISKGLHFPNVTLVGVISADTILNFPDFRSGEKTFQLVSQVAGRAGRGSKKGEVLIQTYQPENYIIQRIMEGNYEGLYSDEIENRKIMNYPPFSRIINIIISSVDEKGLLEYSREYSKKIALEGVEIYGPMAAPIYRIKNRYRYQIFLKGSRRSIGNIKPILEAVTSEMKNNRYRITVDVDPINLM